MRAQEELSEGWPLHLGQHPPKFCILPNPERHGGPAGGGHLSYRRAGALWAPVEAASSLRRSCPARSDTSPEKSWRAGAVELSQVRMERGKAGGEKTPAMSHISYEFWFPQMCLINLI